MEVTLPPSQAFGVSTVHPALQNFSASMTKFKFNFHLKSASLPSTGTPHNDDLTLPPQENRVHRRAKDYITNLNPKRFLTIRNRNQQTVDVGSNLSPIFVGGKSPRTPLVSLLGPRLTRASSIPVRHHRQYTVNLSQMPKSDPSTGMPDAGLGLAMEPDSSSDFLHFRRATNSRLSTCTPIPSELSTFDLLPSPHNVKSRHPFQPNLATRSGLQAGLWSPPAYHTTSDEKGNKTNEESVASHDKTTSHRISEILQQAGRRILADPAFSQAAIFRFLAPLVVFLCILLGMAVIIPKRSAFEGVLGNSMSLKTTVTLVILGGLGLALILLRASIWVIGVLAQSFCEIDMARVFRKSEWVDANGRRMGEAEMVAGIFG